jgi:hypothetical protein
MGGRFWLGLVATVIGVGIAVGILFLLVGAALVAWGVFGALVIFAMIALAIAYLYDKRQQTQYD